MKYREPALIAHGGAGSRAPALNRPLRRRALLAAVERGAEILRQGGAALDAVIATITMLEDDPNFNAGYGSVLTTAGRVEMDAAVMVAEHGPGRHGRTRAGGVMMVSRVRNPIGLARAVMERTPHVLLGGAGAERFAREAGIRLCRPEDLVSPRARQFWLAQLKNGKQVAAADRHGTVGAVAMDTRGTIAAATSTGGMAGKMPGRIGDSAIVGAGIFATARGGASATGAGEAIMQSALCRAAVDAIGRGSAPEAAESAIANFSAASGAEAGIVIADARGRLGYAHNASAMEVATFDMTTGLSHLEAPPLAAQSGRRGPERR
jgi:beta-aspartyl-peptidase (threonine type)